jgi:uncharacterized membrane protein YkoI
MQDDMRHPWRRFVTPLFFCLALAFSVTARAEDDNHDDESDHDKALHAVERGEILPLERVLDAVRPQMPGEIVGLQLEKERGVWVYEFKVIDPSGRLQEIYVDAKTARLLQMKED